MKPSYEELEARCAALAAENAGLKNIQAWAVADVFKAGAKRFESTKAAGFDTDDCLHDAVLVMLSELKTPATDAFLAEVRAQGVDYAIGVIEDCANNLSPGGTGEAVQYAQEMVNPYLDSIHDKLADKSAQLRKGGAA